MLIIDTHCHASPYWYEPVETLLYQMHMNGVEKATLVGIIGQYDNSYMIECMRRYPGRFSVIAVIDTAAVDAPDTLAKLVEQGCEGIRLRPDTRSPGADPLAIWRKADELGITVSVNGPLEGFASAEFEQVFKEFPNLTIVIEHLGQAGADKTPGLEQYKKVLSLARYPKAYLKIPGLGEFCPRPMPFIQPMPFPNAPPLIEMAIDAFGARRITWGSNFPPSARIEGYRNTLKFPLETVKFKSEEDKEWVFGKTAATLWKFP